MTAYLLAVDSGSQSTKVSVIDDHGTVHAAASVPLRGYELGPGGRAVHPDDDLWDSLVEAVRRVLGSFPGRPEELSGIGLCSIRFCRALVDGRGRLTEPVLSWMDARVSEPLADLAPEVSLVCSAGGYLAVRLTGERRDSAASYQPGAWPIDRRTRRWTADPSELERTGTRRELLPELVDPGGLLGELTGDAARLTGLPAGLPVLATANDKAVEALGGGLVEPGAVLLSLGTYVAAMSVANAAPDPDGRTWVNDAAVPGRHLHESRGIRRGMWTVSWLRDLVTEGSEPVDADVVERRLEEAARDVPAGCDGLLTLPDWLAPGHAPHRRGAFLGFDGSQRAPHLYRSVLEGIALTMRGHVDALEQALGLADAPLLLTGGGSRSQLMSQIVADVFGRRVQRLAVPDAAGVGAAICAAVGSGSYPDHVAAVAGMVRTAGAVEPDPAQHHVYERIRAVYQAIPRHTDPLFGELAALRH